MSVILKTTSEKNLTELFFHLSQHNIFWCGEIWEPKKWFHFCLPFMGSLFMVFFMFYDNVSGIICHSGNVVSSVPSSQNLEHKQCRMTACCFCLLFTCASWPYLIHSYLQYWILLLCVDIWLISRSCYIIRCPLGLADTLQTLVLY